MYIRKQACKNPCSRCFLWRLTLSTYYYFRSRKKDAN